MGDTVNGLRAPAVTDPFNPNGDIKNLRDDVSTALPFTATNLTLSAAQPGPVTLGSGVGYFTKIGKQVTVFIDVPITSAGVAGNALRIYTGSGLPAPATAPMRGCGTWWYFDNGANNRMGICQLNTDDGPYFTGWIDNAGAGVAQFGQAPSIAAANGDRVVISAKYLAA